jgi:glycerol uptake facilitator-like aquaporin
MTTLKRATGEAIGTALLLATVVGSGIMGDNLSGGNAALTLLANSLATGAMLVALILTFGRISGAHFNPVVTLTLASQGAFKWRDVPAYVFAQVAGAFVGVIVAHLMFGHPLIVLSDHARPGGTQAFSEFVATFGLLVVIWGCRKSSNTAYAVGAYITAGYWFTASTSFANPAVTIARAFTNTFSGIQPGNVPLFLAAQFLGAVAATCLITWLASERTHRSGSETPVEVVSRGR